MKSEGVMIAIHCTSNAIKKVVSTLCLSILPCSSQVQVLRKIFADAIVRGCIKLREGHGWLLRLTVLNCTRHGDYVSYKSNFWVVITLSHRPGSSLGWKSNGSQPRAANLWNTVHELLTVGLLFPIYLLVGNVIFAPHSCFFLFA